MAKRTYKMPNKCYPKGNQWYKLVVKKTGQPLKFKDPQELADRFLAYVEYNENNPIIKKDVVKGGENAGFKIETEIEKPLTLYGFAAYCGMSYQGVANYGQKDNYKEYFDTFEVIVTICNNHKIDRAITGVYKENIVARLTGLVDKTQSDVTIKDDKFKIEGTVDDIVQALNKKLSK